MNDRTSSDRAPYDVPLRDLAGLLTGDEAETFERAIEDADAEYDADLDALLEEFE